ncbi:hypothetical protein [Microbacterium sp. LEMMJ01]|uniref:hypothetical protein n=1 Tax=Microbacterium sp. LEMMJ01 TaxID=1978350 RepID=UPI00111C527B|nr:hypothetical protein [Microbacterium sp. LEMMJ01]
MAAAQDSLSSETQAAAAKTLMDCSLDQDLPPGARASAALFGSVALCELERHDEAVTGLAWLIDDLAVLDVPDYSASQRIIVAALQMQLSARLAESCKFDDARERVAQTLAWLPTLKDRNLQDFSVSRGISWGSSTVQLDLVRSLTNHALALRSYLEQIRGQTWVRVVRGRSSWVDMRTQLRSADRDGIVLRDAFEEQVEADSNTRHFGRETAEIAGYRSLILAELSGHLSYMRTEREKLAKVLILKRGDDPERVREALRLFRQGHATKGLQSTITWIRAQGPSEALRTDALIVIERVNRLRWCSDEDLLVLGGASDFLSMEEKDRAIAASLIYVRTPRLQGELSWSSWERLWKTVARLLPESSSHQLIASEAHRYITAHESLGQPITNTLARLVLALDWEAVDVDTVDAWSQWSMESERTSDTRALLDTINKRVRGMSPPIPPDVSIELAAHIADEGIPEGSSSETLSRLTELLIARLDEEVEQARHGMMSMGGYQDANVAVAFALRLPNGELWEHIVQHLLDPRVDAGLKDQAVERLADNVDLLPASVATKLRENIRQLVASERREAMFDQSKSTVFGEAMRLSAALGATPRHLLLTQVLRLTTSGVKDRVQAARTIPLSIVEGDATWGHVLLLQLSHDVDPFVRATAGHSLVRSLKVPSDLLDAVYTRVRELLEADGIRVPLAVLHAVQRYSGSMRDEMVPLLPPIEKLSVSGGNYVTRGAARVCLEMLIHD